MHLFTRVKTILIPQKRKQNNQDFLNRFSQKPKHKINEQFNKGAAWRY